MARSARNPHTASAPDPSSFNSFVMIDEGDQTTRPRRSRAEMQALALQMFEQQVYVMRERDGVPYQGMIITTARRRADFQRLTNAIEAVSHKLTSAEYLELYNAAMGVHPQPN